MATWSSSAGSSSEMFPSHGVAPIFGAFPSALVIAQTAVDGSGDWATYGAQLGIGGVLVAFAVWLQDRNSKERKAEIKELRADLIVDRSRFDNELDAQRKKSDSEIAAERAAHEATRQLLLAALTGRVANP